MARVHPKQPQHEREQGWWNCIWCGETTHVVCATCSCIEPQNHTAEVGQRDGGAPLDKCQPGGKPGDSYQQIADGLANIARILSRHSKPLPADFQNVLDEKYWDLLNLSNQSPQGKEVSVAQRKPTFNKRVVGRALPADKPFWPLSGGRD